MFQPKALTCSSCGAPIDRGTMLCPYCKTQYTFPNSELKLVVARPGVHKIRTQIEVDSNYIRANPEGARDYTLMQLREQLAEGLLGYMRVCTEDNPMDSCQIIRGEITVLDPYFGGN